MADKKSDKRSGAPGGERPMRRRAAPDDKKQFSRSREPGKPRDDKGGNARPARKPAKPAAAPKPVERTSAFEGERISKAMARAGVCSRRDAEDWIAQGRVAVNGKVLTSPAVNVTEADKITIDGEPMQARERTRLFLFHKPVGYVTTAHDPEGRPTVFALLEERHPDLPRIVSVGRLDINTEGLLLLTNDGGLARTLELPATGWTRRYRVRAHGEIDQAQLDELRKGVTIDEVTYAPIDARLERVQGANAWIAMSLTEGKNREVKRVMEHLGLDVTRLIRVSYGPFQLGELAEGAVEEVKLKVLREQLGKSLAEFAGVDFSSPLRETSPTEAQEARERADKRARKHVSVLRKQRDEKSEKGPRMRIERGATADRRGRTVAVERVTPTARRDEGGEETRNARRFATLRGERPRPGRDGGRDERPVAGRRPRPERAAAPEGRRPSRFDDGRGERPARRPEARFDERRQEPREEGRFERGPRSPSRAGGRDGGHDERPAAGRGGPRPGRAAPSEGRRPSRFDEPRGERPARRPEARFDERRQEPREEGRAERGPRSPSRAGGREEGRFEKRPPRRDGKPVRRFRSEAASPGGARDERPRRFERPRGDFSAEPGARKFQRPREDRDGRTPRGGESGRTGAPERAPRRNAAPGKAPPRDRGAGAPRGPRKGPTNGPGKGPPKGPRKPRGG